MVQRSKRNYSSDTREEYAGARQTINESGRSESCCFPCRATFTCAAAGDDIQARTALRLTPPSNIGESWLQRHAGDVHPRPTHHSRGDEQHTDPFISTVQLSVSHTSVTSPLSRTRAPERLIQIHTAETPHTHLLAHKSMALHVPVLRIQHMQRPKATCRKWRCSRARLPCVAVAFSARAGPCSWRWALAAEAAGFAPRRPWMAAASAHS